MKAPDTLKQSINELLDKHWDEILEGKDFSELLIDNKTHIKHKLHDSVLNDCTIKLMMYKETTRAIAIKIIIKKL
jgi:hypothetical protein